MRKSILLAAVLCVSMQCAKNSFVPPKPNCDSGTATLISWEDFALLFGDEVYQVQENIAIKGIVISSDKEDNFYGVLHVQSSAQNPIMGLQLETDLRDMHLLYPKGSTITIALKGLFVGKEKEAFTIGGVFSSFGNRSVGRLPATATLQKVTSNCNPLVSPEPIKVTLPISETIPSNTLIQLGDVQFLAAEVGLPLAEEKEETSRVLVSCTDDELALVTSGYATFYNSVMVENSGVITGVYIKNKSKPYMVIRELGDLLLTQDRCVPKVVTSNQVFISELADPNNNTNARFVELYNSSAAPVILNGWKLNRYTNANTTVGASLSLDGLEILAKSTLVIANNESEFLSVYGKFPDITAGKNSPADSNGDDTLVLVDPFDVHIDIFGVIGEDGSSTNHEFEDGRALRKASVVQANTTYTFAEWEIVNDTGAAGTVNLPQNAPQDYTPGIHN